MMRINLFRYYVLPAVLSGGLLLSCSHDELIERDASGSGVISFSTVGNRFSTKVAPMVSDNMRTFRVWGYGSGASEVLANLNGVEVSRASAADDWVYGPMEEWPADGTVDFYAVSPASAAVQGAVAPTADNATFTYTVPAAADDQVDLLVVKMSAVDAATHPSPVQLTFAHALSRIGLKIKTDAASAVFKIKDVKLLNVNSQGTYSFTTDTWSDLNSPLSYEVSVDESWSDGKMLTTEYSVVIGADNGLMVLPQITVPGTYQIDGTAPMSGTYLSLKAMLVNEESEDVGHTFYFPVVDNLEERDPLVFEMGKQYTFGLELRQDGEGALGTKDWVTISGVKWAKYNVDAPGTFANSETASGMFYQFGRGKVGWSNTGPLEQSPAGASTWDSSDGPAEDWDMSDQNPCPDGWQVPTEDQLRKLVKKATAWTDNYEGSGVKGYTFTDTGGSEEVLFLPAVGFRDASDGTLFTTQCGYEEPCGGYYWSASTAGSDNGYFLYLNGFVTVYGSYSHSNGFFVRCVKNE
ncbi:MAG: fimbrillin family protein [Tannerellaceae bacterium]|jgi:uncharacterized protein (TIGR02145 family)|nr:fimbrillin family protein [Tannerellaceae bacterium]